jgi:hypothetical protein
MVLFLWRANSYRWQHRLFFFMSGNSMSSNLCWVSMRTGYRFQILQGTEERTNIHLMWTKFTTWTLSKVWTFLTQLSLLSLPPLGFLLAWNLYRRRSFLFCSVSCPTLNLIKVKFVCVSVYTFSFLKIWQEDTYSKTFTTTKPWEDGALWLNEAPRLLEICLFFVEYI